MTKSLYYVSLTIFAIIVILLFVTSKSYFQLTAAIVLYPITAFLILKLIPRHAEVYMTASPNQNATTIPNMQANVVLPGKVDIVDIEKRTFLKLVGTAGLSFFISSLLGRKAEDLIFNRSNTSLPPQANDAKTAVVEEEYKISEIDDGVVSYYGFVNKSGNWFIMKEDSPGNSFRYSKATDNFSKNWEDRAKLNYDYYHNLF